MGKDKTTLQSSSFFLQHPPLPGILVTGTFALTQWTSVLAQFALPSPTRILSPPYWEQSTQVLLLPSPPPLIGKPGVLACRQHPFL